MVFYSYNLHNFYRLHGSAITRHIFPLQYRHFTGIIPTLIPWFTFPSPPHSPSSSRATAGNVQLALFSPFPPFGHLNGSFKWSSDSLVLPPL